MYHPVYSLGIRDEFVEIIKKKRESCFKVSYKTKTVQVEAMVSIEGSNVSKLTQVSEKIHCLKGGCTEGLISLLTVAGIHP